MQVIQNGIGVGILYERAFRVFSGGKRYRRLPLCLDIGITVQREQAVYLTSL
jgi:hypothetical protein